MTFAFTPAVLRWMRRHAAILTEADMAAQLGCPASTVRSICLAHGVEACKESDPHADIAPVPAPVSPSIVPAAEPATPAAKVHPRLNPHLRGSVHLDRMDIRPGRQAVAVLDRAAARLRTTTPVLCAVLLEIIAADDLVDAVLALEE